MNYVMSNFEVISRLAEQLNLPCKSILNGTYECPIDRIDRVTRKYYLFDGTSGDIPKDWDLS